MQINLRKTYIFTVSCAFFMLGYMLSFNMLKDYPTLTENKPTIILIYFFILSFSGYGRKRITKLSLLCLITWKIIIGSIFISCIINKDYSNALNSVFLILIPLGINITYLKTNINMIAIPAIVTLVPFVIRNIGTINNELGMNLSIVGILTTNIILYKKNNKNIFLIMNFIIFTTLIFFTSSRTSLLSFIIVVLINCIIMMYKKKAFKLIMLSPVLIIAILLLNRWISNIFNNVYDLFNGKWDNAGSIYLFSGRESIWLEVLESGVTLFGNGPNYFLNKTGVADAHNSFIQALGQYGIITFFLYIFIFVILFLKLLKVENKLPYINFFTGYLIISIFEDLFFASTRFYSIMLLFFIYTFMLFNEQLKGCSKKTFIKNTYKKDMSIL